MQPAVATLYDKNSNPLFEFGKRYRNTVRICPFSQAALIGGFGNLAGEVDFWNLDTNRELGKTKAYCTVGIEWAPNGKFVLSSVLYERVKVDNELRIYNALGVQLCSLNFKQSELYDASWQPYSKDLLKKPDLKGLISQIKVHEEFKQSNQQTIQSQEEKPKPKKWFNPAGGNNTFAQIMRAEMSKAGEKGPKKVDKAQYQGLMKEQAMQHANNLLANNDDESPPIKEGWRKNDKEAFNEPVLQQAVYQNDISAIPIEEIKISKHAKRRANKKKKIVVVEGSGAQEEEYDNQ